MKKNEKGFGIVEVLAVLCFVGLIGIAGWYVWSKQKTETSTQTQTTLSPTSNDADDTKYFTVDEWGVKMPVTKVGRFTATLTMGTDKKPSTPMGSSSDTTIQSVALDITGFTKEENTCANTTSQNGDELVFTGTQIYRHQQEDPEISYQGTFKLSSLTDAKVKVGDWWYSLSAPDGTGNCVESASAQLPVDFITMLDELRSNFDKLEAK